MKFNFLRLQWGRLPELTSLQWHNILQARQAVFVVEQQCAYQDADDYDLNAWHLALWHDDQVAAYARVLEPETKYTEACIGRVITTLAYRRQGLGLHLMQRAIEQTEAALGPQDIRIAAQARLEDFYRTLGFDKVSNPFLDDGIWHIEMLRKSCL
jgi:ElaA protein